MGFRNKLRTLDRSCAYCENHPERTSNWSCIQVKDIPQDPIRELVEKDDEEYVIVCEKCTAKFGLSKKDVRPI